MLPMQKGSDGLNLRQRRFAEEYAFDGKGSAAAIRAGYSPRSAEVTASTLIRNPKVAAAIAEFTAKASETVNVTKAWLQGQIVATIKSALADKKQSAAFRGLELLARLNGQIIDQKAVRVVRSFSEMSDEELAALTQDAEARDQASDAVRH